MARPSTPLFLLLDRRCSFLIEIHHHSSSSLSRRSHRPRRSPTSLWLCSDALRYQGVRSPQHHRHRCLWCSVKRGVGVEGPEAGDDKVSDEQEDIGLSMTINDELRLCGMTGDDEDDVAGDAEELFGRCAAEELYGRTAADPLPVDDIDAHNTSGAIQGDADADLLKW